MIPLSSRFAAPLLALALLATSAIALHRLALPRHDSCAGAERLFAAERIGGVPVTERGRRAGAPPGTGILEGAVDPPPRNVPDLSFRIRRGFAPSAFYGLTLVREFGSIYFIDEPVEIQPMQVGDTALPVQWIEDSVDGIFRLRAHLLIHDARPVRSAWWSGLSLAGRQLVDGIRPVTLLMFRAEGADTRAEVMRERARQWLGQAWREFEQSCAAPP